MASEQKEMQVNFLISKQITIFTKMLRSGLLFFN